jgi:uncharacterized protein (TIGR00251 family)
MSIKETKNGTIIKIFVKFNACKFKIELDGDELIVCSTEEPIKGKVNREILKQISKLFESEVEIISGLTSKQKMLLIKNATRAQVEKTLNGFLSNCST